MMHMPKWYWQGITTGFVFGFAAGGIADGDYKGAVLLLVIGLVLLFVDERKARGDEE